MTAFVSSQWQGERTRIPGTTTSLTQEEVERVVAAVLPQLPADVQLEAQDFMRGGRDSLSNHANTILRFAVTAFVSAEKR